MNHSDKLLPSAPNQELFDLMSDMTQKSWLQSELNDVINCVNKYRTPHKDPKVLVDALNEWVSARSGDIKWERLANSEHALVNSLKEWEGV